MGSPCEVLVDSAPEQPAQAVTSAVAACAWRIEQKFSRYREDSETARINRAAGTACEVEAETAQLLDFAEHMWRLSDGRFDITSGVLRRAWKFDGGAGVPSADDIGALLPLVGWSKVKWKRPVLTLRAGMEIDFGGIGKEYAVDLALAAAARLTDAPVLVNFGGDLAATGPLRDGRAWRVGVEGTSVANIPWTLELRRGALATSGDTYRFVSHSGERRPHILDPRTGEPVRGAPRSVTVEAGSCIEAGCWCTLAMLRGKAAEEFLGRESVRHWIQR
jgi:thiamine biosynthesis lipoprotein